MVVIGPLSVQQGGALPPFGKVHQCALEPRSNGSGFDVPMKEHVPAPAPVSKQSYAPSDPLSPMYMDYESLMLTNEFPTMLPVKYGGDDLPQPMSMKYAELYSVPVSSQYPELYMSPGQYNEALFPVNTPNVIPNPCPTADFKQQEAQVESKQRGATNKYGSSSEMDSDDLDLYSLLTLPAPANKEADVSFANDCNPFDLYGFQPEELDLLDPALLDPVMPDDIHYWNGLQKDSSNNFTKQSNVDPVMTGWYGQDKCEGIDAFHSSATLESILLLEGAQALSPVHSELSMVSEDSIVPSNSPAASEKWEKGLRDLFERTFDVSDIEGDYMLPPPNKRQEASGLHWGSEKKPRLSPPSAPPSPVIVSSPASQAESSPSPQPVRSKAKNKHKPPTLLFGKHEGEIIHKLLVANSNARSKPIARDKLITIPVEEFNQLLEDAHLTEIEVAFMKEWRRRGKNKAAAQVARKRKREEVSGLDEEVEEMRQQKVELEKKCDQLRSLVRSLKERSIAAEDRLFQKQSENLMEPVSRNTHLIHIMDDDKLLLIPKMSSKVLVVNS